MHEKAKVLKNGIFSTQVCVPYDFTDEQVMDFVNIENPCGTSRGWAIRKAGHKLLAGDLERTPCSKDNCCVHIMLDA